MLGEKYMKKILSVFTAMILFAACASNAATTQWDSAAALKRVNTIGSKILTASKLPSGITFKVSAEDHVNAYANIDKEVYVYKGLLEFVENDQELAAVISHEIGHIINAHCAKRGIINYAAETALSSKAVAGTKYSTGAQLTKDLAMLKMSRTDEYDADLTGVDLMIKAGYDPRAMISVLNKICENSVDVLSTHPSGIKRLMNIYDYLAYTYPDKVKTVYNTASYKNAMTAINENITKRNAKKNGAEKHLKEMAKLKEKRAKQMAQNTSRTSDPWNTGINIVNTLNATGK
jgi:predicted Zn-dependent protease